MEIAEIRRYDDLLALKEKWYQVLEKSGNGIFSTWEWLSIWWKHFGESKRLVLLLAREKNEICGIAPLMYSVHKMFGLRMGKIEFIGTDDSDYNDFIIIKNYEHYIDQFIRYLRRTLGKWNSLELRDLPENTKSLAILDRISYSLKLDHKCSSISLTRSEHEFLDGLRRKHRKELRRNLRRTREKFKINFMDCSGVNSFAEGMHLLFELHQKIWEARGSKSIFAFQKFRDFHLDIAKSFSQKGWLGLFILKLSDTPVAALYGFKFKSKYYAYITAFDLRYSKYSVGNLLFLHVITECIKEGFSEFDFMRGAETYKDRWNTSIRWNRQAVIIKKGFFACLRNSFYQEYWRQGNRIRYLLKCS